MVLMGWVNRRRDHGNLIFLDLRDRTGITQVVLDKEVSGRRMPRLSGAVRVRCCGEGQGAAARRGSTTRIC